MFKLLFLTHTGTGQPPAALFIARQLIQDADLEDRIDYMEKTLRAQHIARLNAGGCSPGAGGVFIDILSNLERVGDHSHNLAMVVFDIERMHNSGAKTENN